MRTAGIVVLLVIIIALVINARHNRTAPVKEVVDTSVVEGCKPGFLFSETTGKPCAPSETPTTKAIVVSDYDSVVASYETKKIVFTDACVATPIESTYAVGTRILLTNTGTTSADIVLGDKEVTLAPFRYATTVLKTAGTFSATCNDKEVASVNVTAK